MKVAFLRPEQDGDTEDPRPESLETNNHKLENFCPTSMEDLVPFINFVLQ